MDLQKILHEIAEYFTIHHKGYIYDNDVMFHDAQNYFKKHELHIFKTAN